MKKAGRFRRGKLTSARSFIFRPAGVKAIRANLKTSHPEFAMMIGVSRVTLRNWERGRHIPDGPAMELLRVAAENPKAVAAALGT